MRRVLLAATGILLCPAPARADALSALALAGAVKALAPFVLAGLVLLVVGLRFAITDFRTRQPRKRTAVVTTLCLLLGLLMALVSPGFNEHGTWIPNLWLDLYVPVVWGLWAAGRVRRTPTALARTKTVALVLGAALAGVGRSFGIYFPKLMPNISYPYDHYSAGLLVGVIALAGTWALLLHLYRRAVAAASHSVTKLGWLLGGASVAGAGYVLLLRLLVDALDSWSRAAARYHESIHWFWSASWSDAALTLLLYFGIGAGLCWLHWAFYPENTPVDDGQARSVE